MSRLDETVRHATEQKDRKINTIIPPTLYWILCDAEADTGMICRTYGDNVFWSWLEEFLRGIQDV